MAPAGPSRHQLCSRGGPQSRLGRPLRSAGSRGNSRLCINSGLATSRCGLSASTRITRSLLSSGGKRTRSARSRPSPSTSTRLLVASSCTWTLGYSSIKRLSRSATRYCSKVVGQLMRTRPWGCERVRSIASRAACASTSMAWQWRWYSWPSSVTEKCRGERCSRRTPRRSSSRAIRRLSLDLGIFSARPAAAKPPCSTTWAK
ncbi:hypothetical protein D9M68_809150 [compost metagenome]